MTKAQIATAAELADEILTENPSWKYYKCINKAKEMIEGESVEKMEKIS